MEKDKAISTATRVRGYLKPKDFNELKNYLKETGVSESSVVRDAVSEHLKRIRSFRENKNHF